MSSNELCKACTLLEGLERGMANSAIVCTFASSAKILKLTLSALQTDRARKKLDAGGPAPEGLRTIPFFQAPSSAGLSPSVAVEAPS